MRAGKLDRPVQIERHVLLGYDAFNSPTYDWQVIADAWAQQRPNRGAERFAAGQVAGSNVLTFHIRYEECPDLTTMDRLKYNDREWNILDVRELGRRVVWEIDCVAAAATPESLPGPDQGGD